MNPFFSVIVVSLNAGNSLLATINSVLEQTFGDYEIIVKDACSTDGSLESIPKDKRIKIISCKDKGIFHGMNQAVPYAQGKFIFFLNCGDFLFDSSVLEKTYQFAKNFSTPCVLYGDCFCVNINKIRTPPKVIKDYFWSVSNICHQAVFFSLDSLNIENAYDLSYPVAADNELMLQLYKKNVPFQKMDFIVSKYEGGGSSESGKGIRDGKKEHTRMMKIYFSVWERLFFFFQHVYNFIFINRSFKRYFPHRKI